MITVVDICNKALNYLQARPIQTIDDNTEEAIRCKAVFDIVRDTVLADHEWEFATYFEDELTLIVDETIPGWDYLYEIPLDCLAIRKLFIDDASTDPDPIEHRRCISPDTLEPAIAVNIESPILEYTMQVTDPKYWTTSFAEALSLKLASEIGAPLTGKSELATQALNLYAIRISEAKRLDAGDRNTEETRKTKRTSSYEDSRV